MPIACVFDAGSCRREVNPRRNPMRASLFLLLALAASAHAAPVYKCKGKQGETIYQNLPCPSGTKAVAKGEYAPAPDSPDQYYAAARAAAEIHERQAAAADAAAMAPQQPATANADAALADTKADAKYKADLKRWGARMAGPAPDGYKARHPATAVAHSSGGASPSPEVQNCHATGGGNMTCFGSRGTVSNGHVDPNGNATMFKSTGGVQQMHVSPTAQSTCASFDAAGNCN
jgi:hypothetical protein